jgi:uncharacterized protein YjbJ (UPF0337 family)
MPGVLTGVLPCPRVRIEGERGRHVRCLQIASGRPFRAFWAKWGRGLRTPISSTVRDPMADDINRKGVDKQFEGMGNQIRGRAKNIAGDVTGDKSEQIKGKAQEFKGKVQRRIGEAQEDRELDRDLDRDRDLDADD